MLTTGAERLSRVSMSTSSFLTKKETMIDSRKKIEADIKTVRKTARLRGKERQTFSETSMIYFSRLKSIYAQDEERGKNRLYSQQWLSNGSQRGTRHQTHKK